MAKDDPSAAGHHAETERGEEGNMQEGRIPAQIETHHDDHVNASNEMSRTKACRTMHLDCGYEVTAAVPLSMSTEEATTHIITSTYNVSQHQLHVQAMVNQLVSTSTNATSSDRTSVSGSMSASRPPRDPATVQHNLISMTESSLLQPYRHAILLACKDPKSSQGSRLQRDTFLLLIDTDTPRTEYMHLFHPLPTNEEERDTAKMVPSGAAITATSSMDPGLMRSNYTSSMLQGVNTSLNLTCMTLTYLNLMLPKNSHYSGQPPSAVHHYQHHDHYRWPVIATVHEMDVYVYILRLPSRHVATFTQRRRQRPSTDGAMNVEDENTSTARPESERVLVNLDHAEPLLTSPLYNDKPQLRLLHRIRAHTRAITALSFQRADHVLHIRLTQTPPDAVPLSPRMTAVHTGRILLTSSSVDGRVHTWDLTTTLHAFLGNHVQAMLGASLSDMNAVSMAAIGSDEDLRQPGAPRPTGAPSKPVSLSSSWDLVDRHVSSPDTAAASAAASKGASHSHSLEKSHRFHGISTASHTAAPATTFAHVPRQDGCVRSWQSIHLWDDVSHAVAWHPQRASLLTTAVGRDVCFWDIRLPTRPLWRLAGAHAARVHALTWHRTWPSLLLSSSQDRHVQLWCIDVGRPVTLAADSTAPPPPAMLCEPVMIHSVMPVRQAVFLYPQSSVHKPGASLPGSPVERDENVYVACLHDAKGDGTVYRVGLTRTQSDVHGAIWVPRRVTCIGSIGSDVSVDDRFCHASVVPELKVSPGSSDGILTCSRNGQVTLWHLSSFSQCGNTELSKDCLNLHLGSMIQKRLGKRDGASWRMDTLQMPRAPLPMPVMIEKANEAYRHPSDLAPPTNQDPAVRSDETRLTHVSQDALMADGESFSLYSNPNGTLGEEAHALMKYLGKFIKILQFDALERTMVVSIENTFIAVHSWFPIQLLRRKDRNGAASDELGTNAYHPSSLYESSILSLLVRLPIEYPHSEHHQPAFQYVKNSSRYFPSYIGECIAKEMNEMAMRKCQLPRPCLIDCFQGLLDEFPAILCAAVLNHAAKQDKEDESMELAKGGTKDFTDDEDLLTIIRRKYLARTKTSVLFASTMNKHRLQRTGGHDKPFGYNTFLHSMTRGLKGSEDSGGNSLSVVAQNNRSVPFPCLSGARFGCHGKLILFCSGMRVSSLSKANMPISFRGPASTTTPADLDWTSDLAKGNRLKRCHSDERIVNMSAGGAKLGAAGQEKSHEEELLDFHIRWNNMDQPNPFQSIAQQSTPHSENCILTGFPLGRFGARKTPEKGKGAVSGIQVEKWTTESDVHNTSLRPMLTSDSTRIYPLSSQPSEQTFDPPLLRRNKMSAVAETFPGKDETKSNARPATSISWFIQSAIVVNVEAMEPVRQSLGHMYKLRGSSLRSVCRKNAKVAKRVGLPGLEQLWKLVSIWLEPLDVIESMEMMNLRSFSSAWRRHPLGGNLVDKIFSHYEALGDVQTLAMLLVVLHDEFEPMKTSSTDIAPRAGQTIYLKPATNHVYNDTKLNTPMLGPRAMTDFNDTVAVDSTTSQQSDKKRKFTVSSGQLVTTIPDINEGQRQESTVIQLSRSPSPRIFRSPVARAFKFPPSLAKMMKQHPEEESKVKHHRRDGSYSSTTTLLSVSSEKTSLALKGDQPPFDPVIPSKVNSGPKSVTFDKRLSIQSKPPPSTQVERKRSSRRRHKLRILVRQKYNQYACYIYKYATLLYQWGYLERYVEMMKYYHAFLKRTLKGKTSESNIIALYNQRVTFGYLCSQCGVTLPDDPKRDGTAPLTCPDCKRWSRTCSVSHTPVRGSGVFCLVCFHGGHVEHMKAWFSTNTECPTGCGCECLKHMGTFRDIVMDQCSVTPSMSPASEDVPDCSDGSRQGDGVVLSGKSSMSTPRPHLPQLLRTVASTPSVRKIT